MERIRFGSDSVCKKRRLVRRRGEGKGKRKNICVQKSQRIESRLGL